MVPISLRSVAILEPAKIDTPGDRNGGSSKEACIIVLFFQSKVEMVGVVRLCSLARGKDAIGPCLVFKRLSEGIDP